MSREITKAIFNVLNGDATLTALLSTFDSDPAIFTTDPAPLKATLPYIVTAGQVSDTPFDTKTTDGRDFVRDIKCYATNASGSTDVIEDIAERVRFLFHRKPFTITGFDVIIASVTGPIARDEEDVYARILTLQATMQVCP